MSFVFEIIQQHTFLFEIVDLLFTENSVFGHIHIQVGQVRRCMGFVVTMATM